MRRRVITIAAVLAAAALLGLLLWLNHTGAFRDVDWKAMKIIWKGT